MSNSTGKTPPKESRADMQARAESALASGELEVAREIANRLSAHLQDRGILPLQVVLIWLLAIIARREKRLRRRLYDFPTRGQ